MNEQHQLFEQLKQTDINGTEYWSARSISKILGYSEYRHFQPVIAKAKEACTNSEHAIDDYFEDVLGMVTIGSGAQREKTAPLRLLSGSSKWRSDETRDCGRPNHSGTSGPICI